MVSRRPAQAVAVFARPLTLLALLVAVAGCGGSDDTETSDLPPASAVSNASSTTTSTPEPTTQPSTAASAETSGASAETTAPSGGAPSEPVELPGFPKSVPYSDLEFRVTSATVSAAKPDANGLPTDADGTAPSLYVAITAINQLPTQKLELFDRQTQALLTLASPDGRTITDTATTVLTVPAGGSLDFNAVFQLGAKDTDLAGWNLLVGFADQARSTVPLDGPVTEPAYPIDLGLTGAGPAQGSGVGCRQPLDVTVKSAAIDVDLGEPDRAPTSKPFHGRRASAGQRFIRFVVDVFNNGGSLCGGGDTNFDESDTRLVVDGVPGSPVSSVLKARDGSLSQIDAGTSKEFLIAFVVPVTAKTVEFQVGSSAATLFTLPVPMPTTLPLLAGEE